MASKRTAGRGGLVPAGLRPVAEDTRISLEAQVEDFQGGLETSALLRLFPGLLKLPGQSLHIWCMHVQP